MMKRSGFATKVLVATAAGAALAGAGGFLFWRVTGGGQPADASEEYKRVEVKRIRGGDAIKIENDEKIVYAGIRAPYEGEPFKEEAERRNAQLVEGKNVRLRFDKADRDRQERVLAYVFDGDKFVNEILVREGFAWVRLAADTQRYAKELLAAQSDARRAKRGIWSQPIKETEQEYKADPKHGNFHRPTCESLSKAPADRLVVYKKKAELFDRGFAPCSKCGP